MTDEPSLPDALRDETQAAWKRYLDLLVPFRPELHRYCRRLTGNLWDAEDLVQDTLLRGFATLGSVHQPIRNPRGYLVRIATHLWIDTVRRRGVEASVLSEEEHRPRGPAPGTARRAEARDAAEALLAHAAPRERAAFVLKEVFDMSLEDIAGALGTSVGAVKSALHRARTRVREPGADAAPPAAVRRRPSAALVDRFVERLAASDLPGLLELMLDDASIEAVGGLLEVGRDQFERQGCWLWQSVHVHPDLPANVRPPKWRNERATWDGEPVMLSFGPFEGREALMSITRFEEEDGRIARIRAYYLCPETLREVAAKLGHPPGPRLYRVPF